MNDLARRRLFSIVSTYGRTVCHTPRACEIFLHQHCNEFPTEEQVLVEALRHGTVTRLLEMKPGDHLWDDVSTPLVSELAGSARIDWADARWAVDSWALALGKHPETAPPPEVVAPTQPEPPEPSASGGVATSRIWPPFIVGFGGALGAVLSTLIFTFLLYTLISGPRGGAGRADAIAMVMGLALAVAGAVGAGIGGAVGWLLIQAQAVETPGAAEFARWRLVRGTLAACSAAAGATLVGGWLTGIVGIALGSLMGAFSGAVVAGLKG
jgi:hypothetical protein